MNQILGFSFSGILSSLNPEMENAEDKKQPRGNGGCLRLDRDVRLKLPTPTSNQRKDTNTGI